MSSWPSILASAQRALTASLGETAVLSLDDATAEVRGVLLSAPLVAEVGGADVRDTAPVLHLRTTELPVWVDRGARVDVGGRVLEVFDVVDDGEGMTELRLRCL